MLAAACRAWLADEAAVGSKLKWPPRSLRWRRQHGFLVRCAGGKCSPPPSPRTYASNCRVARPPHCTPDWDRCRPAAYQMLESAPIPLPDAAPAIPILHVALSLMGSGACRGLCFLPLPAVDAVASLSHKQTSSPPIHNWFTRTCCLAQSREYCHRLLSPSRHIIARC